MTRVYTKPINYRDASGDWRRIDNSLEKTGKPGYAFVNRANAYRVAFPTSLADRSIRVSTGAGVIGFRLLGGAGHLSASGPNARFASVFPGVSADYVAGSDVLKEKLVLDSAKAAASYSYALNLSHGLRARPTADGAIAIVDRHGKGHFAFRAPLAYDSAGAMIGTGHGISLRLLHTAHGLRMRLAVDPAWLHAANRRYPVVVDPGLNVSDDQDCYILGGSWTNVNGCGNTDLLVGWNGATPYRTLLHFDVQSALPANSQVLGANALVYLNAEANTTATTVEAHNLTHSWTEGTTWNKYDGTTGWTSPGGDFDSTAAYICDNAAGTTGVWDHFSITNLVQQWEDGATPNYGILLKEPTENVNNTLHFTSQYGTSTQVPYLEVDWEPKFSGDQPWYPLSRTSLGDRQSIAVNAANGTLLTESTDMRIAGVGMPLKIQRTFNGRTPNIDEFGQGAALNGGYDMWLDLYGDGATFTDATGTPFHFTKSGSSYTAPPGINASLVQNGDGTFTLTYNKSGTRLNFSSDGSKLTTIKDKNGRTITFAYRATDGLVDTITDTENRTLTFTYDTTTWAHVVSKITDSTGRHVDYAYTANHQVHTFTDGAGKTSTYDYDGSGNLTQITDGAGNITVIGYDTSRRVTSIKRVTNNTTLAGDTTTYTYNSGNTVETDPLGNTTTYYYDSRGRQTKITDGLGHYATQTWDDGSNLPVNFTSGVNQSTSKFEHNVYDADQNLTTHNGADNGSTAGPSSVGSYNLSGAHPYFPDSQTNPQGQTINFSYDSSSASAPNLQSVGVSGQTGLLANYTYDTTIKGQINKSTDANGHDTTYGYETLAPYSGGGGDLKTITPPSPQGATTLGHDGLSRVTSVKDGLAQTTSYQYDGDDRVKEIDYPDTTYVTFTYDGDGNVTQVFDSSGSQTETYNYDHKNRLTSDSGATGSDTYTYDTADNLKTLTDGGGTVTYAYDAANNVCWAYVGSSSNGCASPPTGATTFSYDADNNRTHTVYPGSVDQAATWDNDDRLTEIKATKSGSALTDFAYSYLEGTTDRDRRASVLDTGNGNNKTFYTYNGKGFLQEAQTKNSGGSGSVISDQGYYYDDNGDVCWTYPGAPPVGKTCSNPPASPTKTFQYDSANELCWSLAGASTNGCSTTPTGATTYSYDADGQELSQSGRGTMSWNKRHQATSVFGTSMAYFGPDNSLRLTSGTSSFKYNALGLGTRTVSGSSAYYTRDPGGQLVSDRTSAGTYNYLFDGLGSIVGLTDSTGAVVRRYSYDPYGTVTGGTGTLDNPWQFAGGYFDAGANTVKFGQRYYDPSTVRWTQPDPIDSLGVQLANRYAYAKDDPVSRVDPSGLADIPGDIPTGAGAGMFEEGSNNARANGGGYRAEIGDTSVEDRNFSDRLAGVRDYQGENSSVYASRTRRLLYHVGRAISSVFGK